MIFKCNNFSVYIIFFVLPFTFHFTTKDKEIITNSRTTILNILNSSITSLSALYSYNNSFIYSNETNKENILSIDIDKLYNDKIQLSKPPNKNDIAHRFISEHEYFFDNNQITNYEFIYYKSIAKYDNGFFSNILVLCSVNDTIYLSDMHSNILFKHKVGYIIGKILTYKIIDENVFYLTNKEENLIEKYIIDLHKYLHSNITDENSDIVKDNITIRTFKEKNGQKDNLLYNIYYNYPKMLKESEFSVVKGKNFTFNTTNETIKSINPVITKGKKTINVLSSRGIAYRLYHDSLDILSNETFPINENNTTNIFYNNYISIISKDRKGEVYHIGNSTHVIKECFLNENSEILSYFFDSTIHILFVLLSNGKIYYLFGNSFNQHESTCNFVYFTSTSLINKNGYYLTMLRRDLIISNKSEFLEFINFEEVEWTNYDTYSKIHRETVKMDNIDSNNNEIPKIIKTSLEHYLIIKNNKKNSLLLFHIPNISSKVKGKNDIVFNFKIPIIFIALFVIFIANYYKKKKNAQNKEDEHLKKEVLDELKRYGGVNKKFKEQSTYSY